MKKIISAAIATTTIGLFSLTIHGAPKSPPSHQKELKTKQEGRQVGKKEPPPGYQGIPTHSARAGKTDLPPGQKDLTPGIHPVKRAESPSDKSKFSQDKPKKEEKVPKNRAHGSGKTQRTRRGPKTKEQ